MGDTSVQHNAVPGIIGFIFGMFFQYVDLRFTAYYPNPMQYALLLAIVASPLIAKLTGIPASKDHMFGVGVVAMPLAILWFLGFSYFVFAIPGILWIWMSVSWPQYHLPPFRIGVWHGMGIAFTAFVGVLMVA